MRAALEVAIDGPATNCIASDTLQSATPRTYVSPYVATAYRDPPSTVALRVTLRKELTIVSPSLGSLHDSSDIISHIGFVSESTSAGPSEAIVCFRACTSVGLIGTVLLRGVFAMFPTVIDSKFIVTPLKELSTLTITTGLTGNAPFLSNQTFRLTRTTLFTLNLSSIWNILLEGSSYCFRQRPHISLYFL